MRWTVLFLIAFLWTTTAHASDFTLSSPDILPGGLLSDKYLFDGFGCAGENISPALHWEHAPQGTKSFAVTIYDPDAPTGSGWWHWVVFDIPASVASLPEGAGDEKGGGLPPGCVQSKTDFGKPGFGGACPPVGDKPHRYVFTVYALDVARLDLPADASAAMVGFTLNAHAKARASFTARYGR
ncbi:YbhB/YbcL family Raf kinase inhibitor-like protein [Desulfolutivibrio sulfoxidireducens]|uniref:YbhB/YbcL family Raf kinase inhibitor-like protein n=1 Tax=Desulfolutivibrio sulfoxidireducens TaxID=2773299 RepID=UPI00159EABB6|nr:YbhB/YbcL family Raf kinase inhibitor-like protein [Desulfolutivibrio sulfoxidireducens]QLA15130.1 YbhB/YbcL family Raf kinase inhibitor-like protein [Desulfolutivibrio sulfoxidireducens]QLA18701.1 YbhB/YbcL family Raf kinase inhibitor-like protein [Desulfolutivibrio sulfoxidireducens]